MKPLVSVLLLGSVAPALGIGAAPAADRALRFEKGIFGSPSASLKDFDRFATRAKQSGATHIVITAEDLPWSRWQYDTPGDPYPAWVISNVGLLKIATPAALEKYLPRDYAEKVMGILESRCKVPRRLGLKAAFTTFEPQMPPEAVFTDHPLWRGARDAGGSLEVDMVWTREPDPARIVRKFTRGMAIENLGGPDSTPYKASVGFLLNYHHFYYPVLGIPHPALFLEELEKAGRCASPANCWRTRARRS